MKPLTVSAAAARTGWSPRMLRYLEEARLVVPERTASGYRLYALRAVNQLISLRRLREHSGIEIDEMAFVARLRREPRLRAMVETWFAGSDLPVAAPAWVEWEQQKQQRLLAA